MSGPIRMKLGPTMKHLHDKLTVLSGSPYSVPPKEDPVDLCKDLENLQGVKTKVKADLRRVREWTQSLSQLDQQWQVLIANDIGDAEITAYNTFIRSSGDYNQLILKGQDAGHQLEELVETLGDAIERVKGLLNPRSASPPPTPTPPPAAPVTSNLPKLGNRKWNGDFRTFTSWQTWFNIVFDKPGMSPKEKFLYLLECLEGPAQAAVTSIEITDTNYQLAWDALKELAGGDKRLIQTHWRTIHYGPSISSDNAPVAVFRKNFEEYSLALTQLKQTGEEIENKSVQMLVQEKWPRKIIERLVEKEADAVSWNTSTMMKTLNEIIRRMEEVQSFCQAEKKPQNHQKQAPSSTSNKNQGQPQATSSALAVSSEQKSKRSGRKSSDSKQKSKKNPYCVLHETDGHWANACTVFTEDAARKNKLRENGRCENCCSKNHTICDPKKLFCRKCQQKGHITLFCKDRRPNASSANSITTPTETFAGNVSVNAIRTEKGRRRKILYLVETEICHPKNKDQRRKIIIVIDCGAEESFINAELAREMGYIGKKEEIHLNTFGSKTTIKAEAQRIRPLFKTFDESWIQCEVLTTEHLLNPIYTTKADANLDFDANELQLKRFQPDVLLGIEHFNTVTIPLRNRLPSGFWKQSTLFGPAIGGKGRIVDGIHDKASSENAVFQVQLAAPHLDPALEPRLDQFVKTMYDLEKIGITDDPDRHADDVAAEKILKEHLRINEEGRIEVPLLWKPGPLKVPLNKGLAYGRFQSEVRKLKRTGMFDAYDKIIKDYIKEGIVEYAPKKPEGIESYIPHHGVVKESSATTKLRIVNDGSATTGEKSINDNLFTGPSKIPDAAGFLIRFRKAKNPLVSDIQQAFPQLAIRQQDRDSLRFYWIIDGEVVILRYTRLIFGLNCAPYLLDGSLEFLLEDIGTAIALEILWNKYVDNLQQDGENAEELIEKYHRAKEIFASVKMNVREFLCNLEEVNQAIPEKDRMGKTSTKIIGVMWNSSTDQLELELLSKIPDVKVTKRNVLKTIAKIFNPLGYLIPILLPARIFCQSLFLKNYGWDDQVSDEEVEKWKKIVEGWTDFKKPIDRRISGSNTASYQLHGFCDASGSSFATAIFLRVQEPCGKVTTHLVFAKGHLKPLSGLTIPKLELMGVVIGVRAMNFTETQLRLAIESRHCWTDSTAVLGWIFSSKKQKVYVQNRLDEIREHPYEFQHVRSEDNSADCATRGFLNPHEFAGFSLWWNGPNWLVEHEGNWPKDPQFGKLEEKLSKLEEKLNEPEEPEFVEDPKLASVNIQSTVPEPIIDLNRFSSLSKLLKTVMWIQKWRKIVLSSKKTAGNPGQPGKPVRFGPKDYEEARNLVLFQEQQRFPPTPAQQKSLNLKKNEKNLWFCDGRLANSNLDESAKTPLFLPKKSQLAKLVILNEHGRNCHVKDASALASVRQKYWIPQGRRKVFEILKRHCLKCRRFDAKPFKLPPMPSLPNERVQQVKPFQNSGVDFWGPVNILDRNREKTKAWGVIWTCLVTRLVALFVASDLSALTFLQVFQKFISFYGKPKYVLSDNGSNLKLVGETVMMIYQNLEKSSEFHEFLTREGIHWEFTTPKSPWKGGCYESLIKNIKNSMRRTIGKKFLDHNEFSTMLAQIQGLLNSRPLTYLSDNFENSEYLKPSDFIYPGMVIYSPELDNHHDVYSPPSLDSREKLLQAAASADSRLTIFWTSFRENYLKSLREKHRQFHHDENGIERSPRIGEVVLLGEETPRGEWRLGKVVKIKKSSDNFVRTIQLQMSNGNLLDRPVNHVFPLEIEAESPSVEENEPNPPTDANRPSKPEEPAPEPIRTHQYDLRPRKTSKLGIFAIMLIVLACCGPTESAETHIKPILVKSFDNGVKLHMAPGIRLVSVCVSFYCWEKQNPESMEEVELPTQILLYRHTIRVRFWIGKDEKMFYETFSGRQYCDYWPNCIFCTKFWVYSFQCTPYWLEILLGIGLIGLIAWILKCLGKLADTVQGTVRAVRFCWSLVKRLYRWICRRRNQENGNNDGGGGGGLPFFHARDDPPPRRRNLIQLPIWNPRALLFLILCMAVCTSASDPEVENLKVHMTVNAVGLIALNLIMAWYILLHAPDGMPNMVLWLLLATLALTTLASHYSVPTSEEIEIERAKPAPRKISSVIEVVMFTAYTMGVAVFIAICAAQGERNILRNQMNLLVIGGVLLMMVGYAEAIRTRDCADIQTIGASQMACSRSDNKITCKIHYSVLLTIPPGRSNACLLLKDNNGHPLGTLKLMFNRLEFECEEIIHHWTRMVKFEHVSTKLCPREGSCVDEFCPRVRVEDHIPEFNGEPNEKPGYSFCASGCDSWVLCGCPLPSSACVPYRVFAKEMDQQIYSAFRCRYKEHITIQAQLEHNGEEESEKFYTTYKLAPGVKITHNDISIAQMNPIQPPQTLTDAYFMSNGTSIALLDEDEWKNANLFMCPSKSAAEKMQCHFKYRSNCNIADNQANCEHPTSKLDEIMEKKHVPYSIPNLIFTQRGEKLMVEVTNNDALNVIVSMDGLEMSALVDQGEVEFEFLELSGCARCEVGATFRFKCRCVAESDETCDIHAHLSCSSMDILSFSCSNVGGEQSPHVGFRDTHIDESCELSTPGKIYNVTVTGELHVVDVGSLFEANDGSHGQFRRNGRDWSWLYSWIWAYWWTPYLVFGLLALLITILIVSLLCAMCPGLVMVALFRRRPHQD